MSLNTELRDTLLGGSCVPAANSLSYCIFAVNLVVISNKIISMHKTQEDGLCAAAIATVGRTRRVKTWYRRQESVVEDSNI